MEKRSVRSRSFSSEIYATMSSSHLEMLRSTSCRGLPIPQLIKIIKPSRGKLVLNEVETILVERESDMKVESEHLMEEIHLNRQQVNLLESILEKRNGYELKLVEKLKCSQAKCKEWEGMNERLTEEKKKTLEQYGETTKVISDKAADLVLNLNKELNEMKEKGIESQRKCKELEELVARLTEEKRKSSDREKKATGHCEETAMILRQKTTLILDLNNQLEELKDKNLDRQVKCKYLEDMIERLTEEQNGQSKKMVEELKLSQRKCKMLEEKIERLTEEQKKAKEQYKDTDKILSDLSDSVFKSNKKFDAVKDENLKCQGKCKELEQMIERLTEEKLALNDSIKNVIGQCEETDNILREKTTLILNLNKELEELNKNSDSQRLLQESQEKVCQLDANVMKMKQEIVDLRIEKFMLEESYRQADKVIEELKSKIYEATQTESKLRIKLWESETDAQVGKSTFEDMERRMIKMEETILKYINANMGGPDRNGSNVAEESSGEKVDAAKIIENTPAQSSYTPQFGSKQAIHDNTKIEPQCSGSNPNKTTTFSVDIEIIQIDDNEEEIKPVVAAIISSTSQNSREKDQMITVKASPETPSPHQTNQGSNTSYLKGENVMKWISRGKRKVGDNDISVKSTEDSVGAPWTSETIPSKFHEAEHTGEARAGRWKSINDLLKSLGEL